MDAVLYLMIAALITSFGVGYFVRRTIKKIAKEPSSYLTENNKMIYKATFVEIIPILLIVFSFSTLSDAATPPLIPIMVALFSIASNVWWNFKSFKGAVVNSKDKDEVSKSLAFTLFGGIILVSSIPIIAIIGMLVSSSL